jgi:1-phosphatidylinositol phosphodiesterase
MTLDLANWMSLVDDSKMLSELSIPGTHDSASIKQPSLGQRLTTQEVSLELQLSGGIRFLDIRVGYTNTRFRLYHESTYLNLRFGEVRDICRTFLQSHPRETIIMSLKKEDDAPDSGNAKGVTFQARFDQYVNESPGLWYLQNAIPTLGEARGKIVLFRRFALDKDTKTPRGINAYDGFPDNTTDTLQGRGRPTLVIQDKYSQLARTRNNKWNAIEKLLVEAKGPGNRDVLFVNFISAAGVLHNSIDDDFPDAVAADINPRLKTYLTDNPRGRYGIVITDFERQVINTLIVQSNELPGYWIVHENGAVTALGGAVAYPPSGAGASVAVAIAARRNGTGYFLVAPDGKVYAYGDASNAGQGVPAGTHAVSIAVKPAAVGPAGLGYWILSVNGKVSAYNATHHGQIEAGKVTAVAIVTTLDAGGYWILTLTGRVYTFGSAVHFGDRRNSRQVNVAMAATPDGKGYWILSSHGAVHAFGTAVHYGQGVNSGATARGIAAAPDGKGYWILSTDGNIKAFGSAPAAGGAPFGAPAIGIAVNKQP